MSITKQEREALILVREALASGQLEYSKGDLGGEFMKEFVKAGNKFNMSWGGSLTSCGTIACIGGWMWVMMHVDEVHQDHCRYIPTMLQHAKMNEYVSCHESLHELFYPFERFGEDKYDYLNITPEQAVKAIDNYLETGHPKWEEITGG